MYTMHSMPKRAANRRRRYAVHARTCLGDDALLAHALGEQGLTNGIVDLVRAGVVQVFSLQVYLRTAQVIDRRLA